MGIIRRKEIWNGESKHQYGRAQREVQGLWLERLRTGHEREARVSPALEGYRPESQQPLVVKPSGSDLERDGGGPHYT